VGRRKFFELGARICLFLVRADKLVIVDKEILILKDMEKRTQEELTLDQILKQLA